MSQTCSWTFSSTLTAAIQHMYMSMVVTAVMTSPMLTMMHTPAIADSPVLRTSSALACLMCITSFCNTALLRLYLKYLTSRGKADTFIQNIAHRQATVGFHSILFAPFVLFSSALLLFVIILLGYTWRFVPEHPVDSVPLAFGPIETQILGVAIVMACSYTGYSMRYAFKLAREPPYTQEKSQEYFDTP